MLSERQEKLTQLTLINTIQIAFVSIKNLALVSVDVFWWGCCLAPSYTCLVLCVQQADSRVCLLVIYCHPASRASLKTV